jgi:hypothetical protein
MAPVSIHMGIGAQCCLSGGVLESDLGIGPDKRAVSRGQRNTISQWFQYFVYYGQRARDVTGRHFPK